MTEIMLSSNVYQDLVHGKPEFVQTSILTTRRRTYVEDVVIFCINRFIPGSLIHYHNERKFSTLKMHDLILDGTYFVGYMFFPMKYRMAVNPVSLSVVKSLKIASYNVSRFEGVRVLDNGYSSLVVPDNTLTGREVAL